MPKEILKEAFDIEGDENWIKGGNYTDELTQAEAEIKKHLKEEKAKLVDKIIFDFNLSVISGNTFEEIVEKHQKYLNKLLEEVEE